MNRIDKVFVCVLAIIGVAGLAFCVRTVLTPDELEKMQGVTVVANAADITMNASDNTKGNSFASTGQEILIVQNSAGTTQTLTVAAVADEFGRTGTLTYILQTTEIAVFGPMTTAGWRQSDGNVNIDTSSADLKIGVVRIKAIR